MKKLLQRWLGIDALKRENEELLLKIRKVDKRCGRLLSRPLRREEIERARKRGKREILSTIDRGGL